MDAQKINKGLARAIVAFVFSILGFCFLLPEGILWGVYGALRSSPNVSADALEIVRKIYLILILVFGSISFLSGITALVLHAKFAGIFVYDDEKNERYQTGKTFFKIAQPFGVGVTIIALALTLSAVLYFLGIF